MMHVQSITSTKNKMVKSMTSIYIITSEVKRNSNLNY